MDLLKNLTEAVAASGIRTPAQFEAVALRLSPAQARLFELLYRGPADTIEIRSKASIGNISECAASLNAKLERGGDSRRVICRLKPHRNQFGDVGTLGVWLLEEVGVAAA